MNAQAAWLPGGRLHLQHGPIDLVIGCDGPPEARRAAFGAARARFETVLEELVAELPLLRQPDPGPKLRGAVARRMTAAVSPFAPHFVTPMAAVAGAVADTVLSAMTGAAPLRRAYVNNGGDIALRLGRGQDFSIAISDVAGRGLGRVRIRETDGIGGIATSGRHGRSLSLGIADSVTVLARTAAEADAAATMVANAVDLPGHPAVRRTPARELDPDSDLGWRHVVTGCGPLAPAETSSALDGGAAYAEKAARDGRLMAAALFLQGQCRTVGAALDTLRKEDLAHA
jgi:ApbE superfamily uncharacterized protein (UPF0280 family)